MRLFKRVRAGDLGDIPAIVTVPAIADATALADEAESVSHPECVRVQRPYVYAARVSESFKGEMLALQATLQLERQLCDGKARKVREGEVLELMLQVFKASRSIHSELPFLSTDVHDGVAAIAGHLRCTPTEVLEQLVVQKVAELRLLPRR